jgi:hypothetical protein
MSARALTRLRESDGVRAFYKLGPLIPFLSYRAHFVGLVLLLAYPSVVALAQNERAVVAHLPQTLRTALAKRNCRVPAPPPIGTDSTAAISFVAYRAQVTEMAAADWVVVCERDSTRRVLVYRTPVGASDSPVAKLSLSDWDPKNEGCEGWISIADSSWIKRIWRSATRPFKLTAVEQSHQRHAGILDGVCDGGSRFIWYWTGTRWVRLAS